MTIMIQHIDNIANDIINSSYDNTSNEISVNLSEADIF